MLSVECSNSPAPLPSSSSSVASFPKGRRCIRKGASQFPSHRHRLQLRRFRKGGVVSARASASSPPIVIVFSCVVSEREALYPQGRQPAPLPCRGGAGVGSVIPLFSEGTILLMLFFGCEVTAFYSKSQIHFVITKKNCNFAAHKVMSKLPTFQLMSSLLHSQVMSKLPNSHVMSSLLHSFTPRKLLSKLPNS